jgi:hypothetical protein
MATMDDNDKTFLNDDSLKVFNLQIFMVKKNIWCKKVSSPKKFLVEKVSD